MIKKKKLIDFKLLIIACSSHVDERIKKEALDIGFDIVTEAPIQYNMPQNIINIINIR